VNITNLHAPDNENVRFYQVSSYCEALDRSLASSCMLNSGI